MFGPETPRGGGQATPDARVPHVTQVVCVELPGCCRMTPTGSLGAPEHCAGTIGWVGVLQVGANAWRVFACDGHRHTIPDAHPLTRQDRGYLRGLAAPGSGRWPASGGRARCRSAAQTTTGLLGRREPFDRLSTYIDVGSLIC